LLHDVLDCMCTAIDEKIITALIALDLSAAFDTINYRKALQRLKSEFGVSGTVLNWLESYISNRKQFLKLGRRRSANTPCMSGVPQGSILVLIMFALYVAPVRDVIKTHGIQHHHSALF